MTAHPLRPAPSRRGGTDWHWLTSALEMGAMAGGNGCLMTDPAPADTMRAPRTATRTPGPDARSVGETRDFTIATMRQWGVDDRLDDIVIVVSEETGQISIANNGRLVRNMDEAKLRKVLSILYRPALGEDLSRLFRPSRTTAPSRAAGTRVGGLLAPLGLALGVLLSRLGDWLGRGPGVR